MIMIAPTQPERILPEFLESLRAIAAFPIRPLLLEEQMTRDIAPDELDRLVQNPIRSGDTVGVTGEMARARLKKFLRLDDGFEFAAFEFRRNEAAIRPPLHCFQPRPVLLGNDYDGGTKAWVRWPDGSDDIVPGSRVERAK